MLVPSKNLQNAQVSPVDVRLLVAHDIGVGGQHLLLVHGGRQVVLRKTYFEFWKTSITRKLSFIISRQPTWLLGLLRQT